MGKALSFIKKQFGNCEYILVGDIDPGNPNSLTKSELEKQCNGVVLWLGNIGNIKPSNLYMLDPRDQMLA